MSFMHQAFAQQATFQATHAAHVETTTHLLNYKSATLPITLLPDTVLLVSLPKDSLSDFIAPLLKLGFFTPENRFFSFALTEDELSLLISIDSLKELEQIKPKEGPMTIAPGRWKIIQIYEGPDVLDMTGVVSFISSRLQSENMPIIYLSTFNTDLILIREEHAEKAFQLLAHAHEHHAAHQEMQPPQGKKPYFTHMSVSSQATSLTIMTCSKANLPRFTHGFLKETIFHEGEQKFFSFTVAGNEASFVISTKSSFPLETLQVHSKSWTAFQVSAGSAGSSGASVHAISATLAKNEIALYFLGTYGSDFVLVREEESHRALTVLRDMEVLT